MPWASQEPPVRFRPNLAFRAVNDLPSLLPRDSLISALSRGHTARSTQQIGNADRQTKRLCRGLLTTIIAAYGIDDQTSDKSPPTAIRECCEGAVEGRIECGICCFFSVPYAAPPVGKAAFASRSRLQAGAEFASLDRRRAVYGFQDPRANHLGIACAPDIRQQNSEFIAGVPQCPWN